MAFLLLLCTNYTVKLETFLEQKSCNDFQPLIGSCGLQNYLRIIISTFRFTAVLKEIHMSNPFQKLSFLYHVDFLLTISCFHFKLILKE